MVDTKRYSILIIDDNLADATFLMRLSRSIEDTPFDFHHETTSLGGLARIENEHFDCLLLDYQLDGIDGICLLKSIRESGNDIPVVAITGTGSEHVAVDAMKLDAQDYLTKGHVTPHTLNMAIRNAITRVALQRRNSEQQKELEAFVGMVSHDLRRPIRQIRTYATKLKDDSNDLNDQCQDYVDTIDAIAMRASKLISSLLEYTRHGRSECDCQSVDLNLVVQDVVTDIAAFISESKAEIKVSKLPTVIGDPVGLRQVFQNLINNGIKFNQSPTPTISIDRVTAKESDDNQVSIVIADNGIGIEPRFQSQVFDPLRRLHSQDEYEGVGLGLSTVKRIVDQHQGRIQIASSVGQGSQFRLSLPIS